MFQRYRELQERRANEESEGGFTLIELLIVIVVLGILAAIVIFSLTGVTGQSAVAACNTDAKSVETAVAAYEANPPTGVAAGTAPTSISALVPAYLHAAPTATTAPIVSAEEDPELAAYNARLAELAAQGPKTWRARESVVVRREQ